MLERDLESAIMSDNESFIENVVKHYYYEEVIYCNERFENITDYIKKEMLIEEVKKTDVFTFVGNQVNLNGKYCDLLYKVTYNNVKDESLESEFRMYHTCFIVVELKIDKLKMNHLSQISEYINLLDMLTDKISEDTDDGTLYFNSTVGILLGKSLSSDLIDFVSCNNLDRITVSTFDYDLKYNNNHNYSYTNRAIENSSFDDRLK
jgi:hypothetical protein